MSQPYDWRAARARNKWRNTATMDAFFAALPKTPNPKPVLPGAAGENRLRGEPVPGRVFPELDDDRFARVLDAFGTSDPTEPPKEKSE
jgi:hypothetical protein